MFLTNTVTKGLEEAAGPDEDWIAIHGIFQYATIQVHMDWRATPEHAHLVTVFQAVEKRLGLKGVDVEDAGIYHFFPHEGK